LKFSYSKHYLNHAEGHIFFDVDKGPCIFHLIGAASMSQEQLDQLGEAIAKLLSSTDPSHF
jgi:ribosomal protein L1